MTDGLSHEAILFALRSEERSRQARQIAAFRLLAGIDLEEALAAEGEGRARVIARIERLLRRERHKGASRHWSYDLNRHIALKQALDRLREHESSSGAAAANPTHGPETNMAPRGAMQELTD
jgi:hypothetical protein